MNIEDFAKHDKEAMEEHGWYAHVIPSGDNTPFGYNYHTHGLERSYEHLNIQIVMQLDPHIAHQIVADIIAEIKKGKRFVIDTDYPNLVGGGYMVRFIDATECGRPVLRLLVPDKNGKYEGDYAKQFTMLDSNEGRSEEDQAHQTD